MGIKLPTQQRAAMQIAIKTGVVRRCPLHWYYINAMDDTAIEHAYRLGNYLISHLAKSVACYKGDRQKLFKAILKCRDDAAIVCPHCVREAKAGWPEQGMPALRPH